LSDRRTNHRPVNETASTRRTTAILVTVGLALAACGSDDVDTLEGTASELQPEVDGSGVRLTAP
jgi:hypothetical protein